MLLQVVFIKFEDLVFDQQNTFIYILNKLKKFTNFEYLRQLEEKEGFIENKIMGIQNNTGFFFNKGGKQDFNKDLNKNIINEINNKYKKLLLELNYLKN